MNKLLDNVCNNSLKKADASSNLDAFTSAVVSNEFLVRLY